MRKSFFLSFLLIILLQNAFTQINYSNVAVPYNPPPPVYLRDVFTTPVEPKKYADIQGTPFLDEKWMLARLKVSQYKIVDSISVKLNLYERKLHFMNEKGEELQVAINFEEIDIIDTNSKWKNSVFLPGIANDREAFFQVVTEGSKAKLVKKLIVNKWEIKALNSETQKKFELEERLFLFVNGVLFKTNKNCSSLMDAFNNNQDVVKFISTNNIKCNKEEDLKKLVNYFNSL
jgi:hypothetical protein